MSESTDMLKEVLARLARIEAEIAELKASQARSLNPLARFPSHYRHPSAR